MNEKPEKKRFRLGARFSQARSIDKPTGMLKKTKMMKQRSKFYFRAGFMMVVTVAIMVILLGGVTFKCYYFNQYRSQQDNGDVNIYNAVLNEEGIKIKLEAVYSDGIETYAKISASGLEDIPDFDSSTDIGILNKIKQIDLMDDSGNRWEWRENVTLRSTGFIGTYTRKIFDKDHLRPNEAVFGFSGAPADGAKICFAFDLNNGKMVRFSDLPVHVAKSISRDVSHLDLALNLPYAQGKIQKILYAQTKIQLEIEWKVDYDFYKTGDFDFVTKHSVFIDTGKDEFPWNGFAPRDVVENGVLTRKSLVRGSFSPDQTLTVNVYNDNIQGQMHTLGSLNQILCVIPAME